VKTDPRSPFAWRSNTEPTIFAKDNSFTGTKRQPGKTPSQINSESADRFLAKNGRSLGTITGISRKHALENIKPVRRMR
jgi:hypothetical protein